MEIRKELREINKYIKIHKSWKLITQTSDHKKFICKKYKLQGTICKDKVELKFY